MARTETFVGHDPQGRKLIVLYASRFTGDRPDAMGDVVDPHAFDEWLADFKSDPKNRLPICVDHEWTPEGCIGWSDPDDITVTTEGLLVAAHLDDSPKAERVYELYRDNRWRGASFAYDVQKERRTSGKNGRFNLLEKVSVIEATLCLFGAESSAGLMKQRVKPKQARRVSADLARILAEFDQVERLAKQAIARPTTDPLLAEFDATVKAVSGATDPVEALTALQNELEPRRCNRCGQFALGKFENTQVTRALSVAASRCSSCGSISILVPEHVQMNPAEYGSPKSFGQWATKKIRARREAGEALADAERRARAAPAYAEMKRANKDQARVNAEKKRASTLQKLADLERFIGLTQDDIDERRLVDAELSSLEKTLHDLEGSRPR
jgi:HK97 family phage prohead protease